LKNCQVTANLKVIKNLSYDLREADYVNKNFQDIAEILKLWPILKESYGYQLIEQDFNKKYSVTKDKLLVGWKQFYNKISKISDKKLLPQQALENKKLLDNPDLSDETRNIIEFSLLPHFICPKANKCKINHLKSEKTKNFYKANIEGAGKSLLVHIEVNFYIPGKIKEVISELKSDCKKIGLPLQPFVIVVGKNYSEILEVFVLVNDVMYKIPTFLKAVDILMKIYISYNLVYPLAGEHIYYLIQWAVYEIKTNFDSKIPHILTLINKLKKASIESN
ncbi:uncharacterized protein LOC141536011, partial [Cotesia typhae]|uniref:uncharacterized protein LOC141536011 n=1 Tax=Cotesia typhae TaxID=2053667 RepID=UPI003D69ADBF